MDPREKQEDKMDSRYNDERSILEIARGMAAAERDAYEREREICERAMRQSIIRRDGEEQ